MSDGTSNNEKCPNCGNADQWYPTGRVKHGDPKNPVEMSVKGGHCLICDYEEDAVYQ